MKKAFLVILAITLFVTQLFAQSFEIKYYSEGTETVVGNEPFEVNLPGVLNDMGYDIYFNVYNLLDVEVPVRIAREVVSMSPDIFTTYCVGSQCVASDIMDVPSPIEVGGGFLYENNTHLKLNYTLLRNVTGSYQVNYHIINTDVNDTVTLQLITHFGNTNIEENDKNAVMSAYPNPATSVVNVNFELPQDKNTYELVIRNLLGQVQHKEIINATDHTASFSVNNFTPGIYLYSIENKNSVVAVKKLIVE